MLAACAIISAQDLKDIQRGHGADRERGAGGDFVWQLDLEDVHLNIEKRLLLWLATQVSDCTQDVPAMIKWRPMCVCICATLSMI